MHKSHMRISPVLLGSWITLSLLSPTVFSATSQEAKPSRPAALPNDANEPSANPLSPFDANHSSRRPGPAWKTIGGTVKQIKGDIYIVEDYEGNQLQLYVSRDTKRLRGQKKVGDRVRVEITREGFANSIQ